MAQLEIEIYEDAPWEPCCTHCGQPLEWIDCDACGGEGEFDAYESDPLWFNEGDTEDCYQCGGDGGWWWCDNPQCPGKVR